MLMVSARECADIEEFMILKVLLWVLAWLRRTWCTCLLDGHAAPVLVCSAVGTKCSANYGMLGPDCHEDSLVLVTCACRGGYKVVGQNGGVKWPNGRHGLCGDTAGGPQQFMRPGSVGGKWVTANLSPDAN